MLDYTGHPLVDVGAATIAAFAQKTDPRAVTVGDLEALASFLEEQYQRKYLTGYLTCVFPNSAYVNPTAGPEKKRAFLDAHLYAFREPAAAGLETCGICGRPAGARAFRQHVPMLTGEGALNFFPNGRPGLPLCAACMISMAALPLGALRCAGRALIVHADDPDLTYHFAREHLLHNRRLLQLQDLAGDKFPDAKQPRTRLVETLQGWAEKDAQRARQAGRRRDRPTSLTAYHFSNSGQGPDLEIYRLPAPVFSFLLDAEADDYRRAWHAIVQAGWRADKEPVEQSARRNLLYDDLFDLPEGWGRFVQTHFLRRAYRSVPGGGTRGGYSLERARGLINWPLTDLFLRRIAAMEKSRVEAIREFGDRVAAHIERNRSFWDDFNLSRSYRGLCARLIRANREEQKAGRPPLIGFDDFITIFEHGEDQPRSDWWLARDLVLIRVIEQLHQREFFQQYPEALDVESAAEQEGRDGSSSLAA